MGLIRATSASDLSDAYLGWWQLAGVDSGVSDDPVNWLAAELTAPEPVAAEKEARIAEANTASPAPQADAVWPNDIAALQSAVREGAALPGNGFGRQFAAPVGQSGSAMMIISDFPDPDDLAAGAFGSGTSGRLLKAMLSAVNIELSQCYWTGLATTAPASGELPEAAFPSLAAFVRHQISLVQPAALLMMGTAASRAMLGLDMFEARGNLREFNHDGGNMAVIASFHPRTLIAQPNLKAKAWEDLQMLAQREAL